MDSESTKESEVNEALGISPETVAQENESKEVYNDAENDISQQSLIDALNIPVQENVETQKESEPTVFEKSPDDDFDDLDDDFKDTLNSGGSSGLGDDMDFLFDDYKLMAEMGVEILDMVMCNGAMMVANDWGNEEKYKVSEARKKKIKRPLELLLAKREKKVSPEVMFFIAVAVVYAPMYITAFQEKKRLKDEAIAKANKQRQQGNSKVIPMRPRPAQPKPPTPTPPSTAPNVPVVDEFVGKDEPVADIMPMQIPVEAEPPAPKKRRGRPKGSKDTSKRKSRKK